MPCDNCQKCFTPDLVCDKKNDCDDATDEMECPCDVNGTKVAVSMNSWISILTNKETLYIICFEVSLKIDLEHNIPS